MARLVVNPDSAEAWEIELRPGTFSLGRSEENDFQIEHDSVSSSHCQIEVAGSGARLRDLGSICGTFVDGQLVEQARLRSGQEFRLGEVRLRFESGPAEEPAASPESPPLQRPQPGTVRPDPRTQRPRRFGAQLRGAFVYPLAGDGAVLLSGGTVFLSVIEALKFFARYAAVKGAGLGSAISLTFLLLLTLFATAYLNSYLQRVVVGTAMGEQSPPDWPELVDFTNDLLSPLFQLMVVTLASLVPAIIVGILAEGTERWVNPAVWITCGLGVVYFPMAYLAVSMFDSVAAVNPLLVVPSILRIPGSYLIVVLLLVAALAAKWPGAYCLARAIPVPILPSVISTVVGLYLLMVEARILGLFYLANKDRLGWFESRERRLARR